MSGTIEYNSNLKAFVAFANNSIESTDKNSRKEAAVSRIVSANGQPLKIEDAPDDSRYSLRFNQQLKNKNNAARDTFINSLIEQFGSYEDIPDVVKSKMKETDYGFTGNDHRATSGRPLSAERIHEVDQAIQKDAAAHPGKYAGMSLFVTLKESLKDGNPDNKQAHINTLAAKAADLFKDMHIDGDTKIPFTDAQDESYSLKEIFECFFKRPCTDNQRLGMNRLRDVFVYLSKQLLNSSKTLPQDSQELTEVLRQLETAKGAYKELSNRFLPQLKAKNTFPPLNLDNVFADLEEINNQNGQDPGAKLATMRTVFREVVNQIQDIPYVHREFDIDKMLAPFLFNTNNEFSGKVKFAYAMNNMYIRLKDTMQRFNNQHNMLPDEYKAVDQVKNNNALDDFKNKLDSYIQENGENFRSSLKDFAGEYIDDELNDENWWNDNKTDFEDIGEAWENLDKTIKREAKNQAGNVVQDNAEVGEPQEIKVKLEELAKEIEEECNQKTLIADSKALPKITSTFCLLPGLTPRNNTLYKDLLMDIKPLEQKNVKQMDLETIYNILHSYNNLIKENLNRGEDNKPTDQRVVNSWSTTFLKNLKLFSQTVFPHNEFSREFVGKLKGIIIDSSMLPDIKQVHIKKFLMKFTQDLFKDAKLEEQEFDEIAKMMMDSDNKVEIFDAMNRLFEEMNKHENSLTDPHEKYMYKIKRNEFYRESQKQGIAFNPKGQSYLVKESELLARRFGRRVKAGQEAACDFLQTHFKNTFNENQSIDNGETRKKALEAMDDIARRLVSGNENDFSTAKDNLKQLFEECIGQMNDAAKANSESHARKTFDAFLESLVFQPA